MLRLRICTHLRRVAPCLSTSKHGVISRQRKWHAHKIREHSPFNRQIPPPAMPSPPPGQKEFLFSVADRLSPVDAMLTVWLSFLVFASRGLSHLFLAYESLAGRWNRFLLRLSFYRRGGLSTRTAHFSLQHIEDLWQLVETSCPQKLPAKDEPWIPS